MSLVNQHPKPAELEGFAQGTLSAEALAAVESHLAGCSRCRDLVAGAGNDALVELLRRAHHRTPSAGAGSYASTVDLIPESPAVADVPLPSSLSSMGDSSAYWLPESLPEELAHHPRYRIRRLLGQGGMGSVYEAEHRLMRRSVALKVINRAFTASVTAVKRFRREVRAAARLSHPNIVAAYDADQVEGTHFLVMEYVEGVNLARLVRERGPLTVAEACDYARQAALGLQHAHEQGMVHRDVKPDNLIRCADGRVKVLDFGLAALLAESGQSLTDERIVVGTPEFMAPEQGEDARRADSRSDIYSLGCTLFYLLTGLPPYPAETPALKLLAHREQPLPSLRAVRADAPVELAAVIERLLAKQPQDRYASAGEVAAVLLPFTQATETSAKQSATDAPPPGKWRRGMTVGLLGAALFLGLMLVAGVIYYLQADRGKPGVSTESSATTEGSPQPPILVEGGTRVTEKPVPGADREVFRKRWNAGRATCGVDLSPDGRLLISMHYAGARVWDVASEKLLPEPTGVLGHFSADTKKFITIGDPDEKGNQLRVYDTKSGSLLSSFGKDPSGYGAILLPREGETVVVTPVKGALQYLDMTSGKEVSENRAAFYGSKEISEFLQKRRDKAMIACVLPGAREVLGRHSENGTTLPIFDVGSGRVVREISIPGVDKLGAPEVDYWLSDSTCGRDRCPRVAVSRRDGTIHVIDLATGKPIARLNAGNFQPRCLAMSEDGRFVAACAANEQSDVVVWRLPDPSTVAESP